MLLYLYPFKLQNAHADQMIISMQNADEIASSFIINITHNISPMYYKLDYIYTHINLCNLY